MPDTTPPASQTTEAPPPEDGWRPDLSALRARLDDIDDQIHDLLMDRAQVVEGVARSGKTAAFRPGREASILRRLLGRHTGKLSARTLVRMWREMLAGTTAMQGVVTVAVYDPSGDGAVTAMAREHFGALTAVAEFDSADAALAAVRSGSATVAVLAFPAGSDVWWPALAAAPRLYINARLPFWADRPAHVPVADVLVVGLTPPDASGDDRSFILSADRAALADAGLRPGATHDQVVEVAGLIAEDDPRLPIGAIALGGYAVPVVGDLA